MKCPRRPTCSDRQFDAAAAKLFPGWLDRRSRSRNLLRFMFLQASARTLVQDWPHRAARLVAEFRAHCVPHVRDAPTARLIEELEHDSAEFRRLWRTADVAERHGGERVFHTGKQRLVAYQQLTLTPANAPGFLFVMLLPAAQKPKAVVP